MSAQTTKKAPALHYLTNPETGKCSCGVTLTKVDEFTVADTPADVTCKRCLAALAKAPAEPTPAEDIPPVANPGDAAYSGDKTPALDNGDDFPAPPTPKDRPIGTPDLSAKAKAKVAALTTPKVTKPKNVHLSHEQLNADGTPSLLKSGEAAPQTLCRIPGPVTDNPDEVTCKVCLAKIHGTKPTNAVPEEVKAARKAFRSFVARATYLAYMDGDCTLSGSWCLRHTNMAGDTYEISTNCCDSEEDGLWINGAEGKAHILSEIERLGWSCGEE